MKKTIVVLSLLSAVTVKSQISTWANTFSNPTTASGGNSVIGGYNTINQLNSYGCFLSGWGNTLNPSGGDSHQLHIFGSQNSITTPSLSDGFIFGYNNSLTQSRSFVIGNSSSVTGSYAFAMGNNVSAQATNAIVLGNYSSATGQNSMAFGTFCSATAVNSVALGSAIYPNYLVNSTPNSLMVSFNNTSSSTRPTFFVTAPNTTNGSGKPFDDYGTVGIGTNDTKGHTLGVRGDIIAEKMQVALYALPWPDYVFSKDYALAPLGEVEKFIKENNHLPEMPEASVVQANGYDLADMDAALLKKVEELTLYVIELKKENEKMKTTINELIINKK